MCRGWLTIDHFVSDLGKSGRVYELHEIYLRVSYLGIGYGGRFDRPNCNGDKAFGDDLDLCLVGKGELYSWRGGAVSIFHIK